MNGVAKIIQLHLISIFYYVILWFVEIAYTFEGRFFLDDSFPKRDRTKKKSQT